MKDQITLTDVEYRNRKKTTKREEFLNKMEEIIPWKAWVEMIRPYYPKGEHGRPVRGIETMLRMYLMQTWFNLSDEGTEDSIYDSYAMRSFLGINFIQTKKGNQWYHGMKVHAGVDAGTGYIHTIEGTAANVHDSTEATKLIREDDHVHARFDGAFHRDQARCIQHWADKLGL